MRRLVAGVAVVAALLLAVPAPAAAHAGLTLVVNDDGRGNLSVDVTWADGHPVTEPMAGTMLAVSTAGRQVGPVALTRLPGRPTLVHPEALAAGTWQVTVDVALPGIGRCAAPVTVAARGAAPKAGSTRCAAPPPPSAPPAAAQEDDSSPGSLPVWATVLLVVAAGGAAAGVLGWRRRAAGRRRPAARPAARSRLRR
jgi:hypothetical protein